MEPHIYVIEMQFNTVGLILRSIKIDRGNTELVIGISDLFGCKVN